MPDQAQAMVEQLYRNMERRIAASPPGLCPGDMALNFLNLCQAQTCGKCVPCRIGLAQLSNMIREVLEGEPQISILRRIENTAQVIVDTADCAIGIDAANPGGDVSCWMDGETLYWESLTAKGAVLTAKVKDLLSEGDDPALDAHKAAISAILDKLPLKNLSLAGFDGNATEALFDRPEWAELSEACIGCGTCTFVCPTCQCYDIRDFNTGHGIQRFRCWDSCMYSDFTKMAHGNPRLTQKERFRQRFMHKLVYYPANNEGLYSCVGCGRCLIKCPISMNIVKVIKTLGVKDHE